MAAVAVPQAVSEVLSEKRLVSSAGIPNSRIKGGMSCTLVRERWQRLPTSAFKMSSTRVDSFIVVEHPKDAIGTLPGEIRLKIYTHYLEDMDNATFGICPVPPALAQTNRKTRAEIMELAFKVWRIGMLNTTQKAQMLDSFLAENATFLNRITREIRIETMLKLVVSQHGMSTGSPHAVPIRMIVTPGHVKKWDLATKRPLLVSGIGICLQATLAQPHFDLDCEVVPEVIREQVQKLMWSRLKAAVQKVMAHQVLGVRPGIFEALVKTIHAGLNVSHKRLGGQLGDHVTEQDGIRFVFTWPKHAGETGRIERTSDGQMRMHAPEMERFAYNLFIDYESSDSESEHGDENETDPSDEADTSARESDGGSGSN